MHTLEIAMNLTLEAIENKIIGFDDTDYTKTDDIEKANALNAKQIVDFYNAVYSRLGETD